jgi:hypothetical protein
MINDKILGKDFRIRFMDVLTIKFKDKFQGYVLRITFIIYV